MTCASRFFQSETLLRELFPALHGGESGKGGLSPRPSVNPSSESEPDDGVELAQDSEDVVEDADPFGSPNPLPSPTGV